MPSLFAKKDASSDSDEESPKDEKMDDDENPF